MVLSFLASEIVDNLVLGAQTTLIGLGVVFLMLFLLVGVLKIFEKCSIRRKPLWGLKKLLRPLKPFPRPKTTRNFRRQSWQP